MSLGILRPDGLESGVGAANVGPAQLSSTASRNQRLWCSRSWLSSRVQLMPPSLDIRALSATHANLEDVRLPATIWRTVSRPRPYTK